MRIVKTLLATASSSSSSATSIDIAQHGFPCARSQHHRFGRACFLMCSSLRQINVPLKAINKCRKKRRIVCSSELVYDAPFAVAIGACIVSSLVLGREDNRKQEQPAENEVRNGAMTIISFIPLFNWLVWVFAYMDTNDQRYLFYAAVYLAPYLRNGFSLSSGDNWLLILSFMACIAHVQIDVNLDTDGDRRENPIRDALAEFQSKIWSQKLDDRTNRFTKTPHKDELPDPNLEEEFRQRELLEFDKKLLENSEVKEREHENLETVDPNAED